METHFDLSGERPLVKDWCWKSGNEPRSLMELLKLTTQLEPRQRLEVPNGLQKAPRWGRKNSAGKSGTTSRSGSRSEQKNNLRSSGHDRIGRVETGVLASLEKRDLHPSRAQDGRDRKKQAKMGPYETITNAAQSRPNLPRHKAID